MKKLISFLLICVLAVSLASCMSVGDMEAPDDGFFSTEKDEANADAPDESETAAKTEPQTEAETEPPVPPKQVLKFVAAGDALIHSAIYWEAETKAAAMGGNYTGKYYFKDIYDNIAEEVKNADIAFVNHEAPIANTNVSGYPNFNAPKESGDALVEVGFNVVNIANNHMYDADARTTGYADTINYWKSKDVLMIGGYESQADYDNIRIMNVDGVTVAFLAYTYGMNGNRMNSASANAGYVSPVINDATIVRHIGMAKEKADLVFVSMHWDATSENVFPATNEQKRLAKLIADNGADVIIGHHSHTIQPVEWITGKDGNKTLCFYSVGNLISGMLSPKNVAGGLMTFDIVKENGEITIENPVYKPTVCHFEIANFSVKAPDGYPKRTGFKVYMLEDYTAELAKKHGVQYYGAFTLDTLKGYAKTYVPSEFLPDYLK